MNRGGNMSRSWDARDFFPQIFFQASGVKNHRIRMTLLEQGPELVLGDDRVAGGMNRKVSRLRRDSSMFKRPPLIHPLHPATVENTEALVSEIFQHPEHPSFIAPIVEWI